MRLIELLHETGLDYLQEGAKSRYLSQVQGLRTEESIAFRDSAVEWAIQALQRQDRIVWFMRYVKLRALFIDATSPISEPDAATDIMKRYKSHQAKMMKLTGLSPIDLTRTADAIVNGNTFRGRMQHFLSLGIQSIDDLTFDKQDYGDIIRRFEQLENEWKESRKRNLDAEADTGARKVIEFPDGSAWWLLDREYCEQEADAMGHCGNAGGEGKILSYRTPRTEGSKRFWRPHLTFILHEDGFLGEMKGRGNDKPSEKYHPYIVKLLSSDLVKGIRGGGYLPGNNFSIMDLDESTREKLIQEKPDLATLGMKIGKMKWSDAILRAEDELQRRVNGQIRLHDPRKAQHSVTNTPGDVLVKFGFGSDPGMEVFEVLDDIIGDSAYEFREILGDVDAANLDIQDEMFDIWTRMSDFYKNKIKELDPEVFTTDLIDDDYSDEDFQRIVQDRGGIFDILEDATREAIEEAIQTAVTEVLIDFFDSSVQTGYTEYLPVQSSMIGGTLYLYGNISEIVDSVDSVSDEDRYGIGDIVNWPPNPPDVSDVYSSILIDINDAIKHIMDNIA